MQLTFRRSTFHIFTLSISTPYAPYAPYAPYTHIRELLPSIGTVTYSVTAQHSLRRVLSHLVPPSSTNERLSTLNRPGRNSKARSARCNDDLFVSKPRRDRSLLSYPAQPVFQAQHPQNLGRQPTSLARRELVIRLSLAQHPPVPRNNQSIT